MSELVRAHAPGRVNLIGEHTDYTGGFVFPMAIDRGTTIEFERGGDRIELVSATEADAAVVPLSVEDPTVLQPTWARYIAGVVSVVHPAMGGKGTVTSDLPIGAGLSSSAALETAMALALGFEGTPFELALACQQAEQIASGVPCGIMDQLSSAAGVEGKALLIDCTSLDVTPVALPEDVVVVVRHSGQQRTLVGSEYADRRASTEQASAILGPLRQVSLQQVETLEDEVVRKRARHIVSENQRVLDFVEALRANDLEAAGRLMGESHASMRDDFEITTPIVDAVVAEMAATPGVYGARMTGGGFGGCCVALATPDSPVEGWRFRPAAGAAVNPV